MVRKALILTSEPHFADNHLRPEKPQNLQTPSYLTGAKSILRCSLERAIAQKNRHNAMLMSERYLRKNGVTHDSAPHRLIANSFTKVL